MNRLIKEGEQIECASASVQARKILFKQGSLRKHPITNKIMVLYELDRNSSMEITKEIVLDDEEKVLRQENNVHTAVGDYLDADAIRLYVHSTRNCLRTIVKEGVSARHGASLVNVNLHSFGVIKTSLPMLNKAIAAKEEQLKLLAVKDDSSPVARGQMLPLMPQSKKSTKK